MEPLEITPRNVALTAGYLLLGVFGTALASVGALNVLRPFQPLLYDTVYLAVGPTEATQFAILTHFALSGAVAIAIAALVGEYASDRGANARAFGVAIAGVAALLLLFLVVSLVLQAALPIALAWIAVLAVAVPAVLRFGYGVRSGGVPAFVGGIPVLVLLLLLAGFGLGWGWGYVVIAEEVSASEVGGAPVVDLDEVPQVREDLFAGDCEETGDGAEVCYLQLRGYEHELEAARFMARHGVRCPLQGAGADSGSFVTRHDGTYYRVSCSGHGD